MMRHLVGSWLFASFLVVVAVATWRVLDARRTDEPVIVAPPPPPLVIPLPTPPTPPTPPQENPCGGGAHTLPDVDDLVDIQIGTQPFADTWIDGKRYGSTPFYGRRTLRLPAGEHDVRFIDKNTDQEHRYLLTLREGGYGGDNKVIVVLGRAEPRVTGNVSLRAHGQAAMTDARAQQLFAAAVDDFRAKDATTACRLLKRIIDGAAARSRWGEKAANLSSRRCD